MSQKMRSMLFAPGNKYELLQKFSKIQPDIAIIDLEDAVPDSEKQVARENLQKYAQEDKTAVTTYVRVNALVSQHFEEDIRSIPPQIAGIVIPKVNDASDIERATQAIERNSVSAKILVGIETVKGLMSVQDIFGTASVFAAYFGAEDYVHDLGGLRTDGNDEVLFARTQIGISSRLFGVPVVDQIVADFSDSERFMKEAQQAKSLGFTGKLCIHPSQVPLANQSFSSTPEEIQQAIELLKVYDEAVANGTASVVHDGQMVDEALAKQARRILSQNND
ncbi:MAG: CoA ester lyase [Actinomycetota bacterium]|nr:CoA ester lyase [Actinomycetota bacterium]MEC7367302.1 CoA ester lyase [Actinomycetota bacterium]MEC7531610.1 CoA ester lyase [Actinomycetota bacterium]MEC8118675.1 CoA ester lyase [Actinomycetota bacterium]MEC8392236.1 CoA ester lyase [Actinomycetota bacterium]